MGFRIVEIEHEDRYLHLNRGFLVVSKDGEDSEIPLDDVGALLLHGPGCTLSQNLIAELAARGVAITVCDNRHMPVAWFWPAAGHHIQTKRILGQWELSRPQKKQLWKQVVRSKILFQARHLESHGISPKTLERMAKETQSGDPTNQEGQAARFYWQSLFGKSFRRDPQLDGVNSLLNYGYAIIRSAMARAVMSAGLHPAVALFHHNAEDSMPLVDDLMEPFRPLTDAAVLALAEANETELNRETKAFLVQVTEWDLTGPTGRTPVRVCMQNLATSLGQFCLGEAPALLMPEPPPVEDWKNLFRKTDDEE